MFGRKLLEGFELLACLIKLLLLQQLIDGGDMSTDEVRFGFNGFPETGECLLGLTIDRGKCAGQQQGIMVFRIVCKDRRDNGAGASEVLVADFHASICQLGGCVIRLFCQG